MNVVTQLSATHECDRDLRLQAVFEGAAIGIGICQFDGRILEANLAFSRMLGCSQQELTETYVGEFCPELFSELFPGPFSELCSEPRGENGRDQRSSAISLDQRLLGELMRGERGSFEIEKHYRRKDGTALWAHLTVWLGHDERRQPAYLIVTLADATGRKQVEEHLREAEKMEVIGRLAGGIAHDFNNLLTGILLYCDLLSAGLDRGEADGHDADRWKTKTEAEACELCRHIEEVRRAGEQGAAMTQQLLAIARKQVAEPRPVPINEVVAATEDLLRRLIGEQIELVLELESGLDPQLESGRGLVLADPAQLRQVLLNLVLNARDAMPRGGRITVSTRAAEFPGEGPAEVARGDASGSVRRAILLAVTDNGVGMEAETRARLFEPFFTTKKPGDGTGLGLATVQRIVNESGGMIKVESGPGCGARIDVFLPAIEDSAM